MSRLNSDQEVLNKGRKNTLKDVDAPLRDQIPAKLAAKLKEMKIGEKVVELWNAGNAQRSDWLFRQQEYLNDWDEFLTPTTQGPFEGASTLHLPMPLIVCKTLHARFLQALLGIEPPFTVRPRTPASTDRADMVQAIMEYALKEWVNYYTGIAQALDAWIWDWITTGCGLLKARWDCTYSRFMDVQKEKRPGIPQAQVDQDGNEVLVPTVIEEEKEVAVTKKTFEGPVVEDIRAEDLLIIGGKGDPQRADAVIQSNFLTASELWTAVDRKIFDEDAVEAVIKSSVDSESASDPSGIKSNRALNAGVSSVDSEVDLDRYQILESYLRLDVDGSGINSDVVVWVHSKTRELLRATYLHRINKAGERPFFKIDYHLRAGQDYGVGMVEMLHPLSIELDAMRNMRIDFGLLSTMPFGFYKPTTSIDPQTINLQPGVLIPLDNPQSDIYFPNLGNRTAFGFQEEAAIQTMVERLTNISDLSLGIIGGQGATRTATGTRAILGEASSNLDVYIRRMNLGWKRCLEYILHMLQQRLQPDFSFRLTADDSSTYWGYIKERDDIAGDFDLEIAPNSTSSNKAVQQEIAQQLYQITANPLDIQLGVVTPLHRYNALKLLISSLGIKDTGRFIQKPQQERIFSPQEEVDRVMRGIPTPVTPQGDHEGYLGYFENLMASDELLGQLDQSQVAALAQQAQQHQQMLQALQEMSAQQRNADQMRTNAAQSQQQAPVGMSAMQTPEGLPQ
jgi:hypothetical protein